MTRALDVANDFIVRHGDEFRLSNLKLNKLVYYAQAVMLQRTGRALFDDDIEAWQYGPVEPEVYDRFREFGARRIKPSDVELQVSLTDDEREVVDDVVAEYGSLTAFDLVEFSHREGSAWKSVYQPNRHAPIPAEKILRSKDGLEAPSRRHTLAGSMQMVANDHANAMRLLERGWAKFAECSQKLLLRSWFCRMMDSGYRQCR